MIGPPPLSSSLPALAAAAPSNALRGGRSSAHPHGVKRSDGLGMALAFAQRSAALRSAECRRASGSSTTPLRLDSGRKRQPATAAVGRVQGHPDSTLGAQADAWRTTGFAADALTTWGGIEPAPVGLVLHAPAGLAGLESLAPSAGRDQVPPAAAEGELGDGADARDLGPQHDRRLPPPSAAERRLGGLPSAWPLCAAQH